MPTSFRHFAIIAILAGSAASARATTKGLNQIVTPDVQPQGDLSISAQVQHIQIGNGKEAQLEYGITKRLEIAAFQGFSPPQQILGMEYGLIQKDKYLLSTGFVSLASHNRAVPFLEGGYYLAKHKFILGEARVFGHGEGIAGYAFQATKKLQLSADYQSGDENSKTLGFTYSFTDRLSLNPALYFTNIRPRHTYGYAVLTYTFPLNEHKPAAPPQEQRTQESKTATP